MFSLWILFLFFLILRLKLASFHLNYLCPKAISFVLFLKTRVCDFGKKKRNKLFFPQVLFLCSVLCLEDCSLRTESYIDVGKGRSQLQEFTFYKQILILLQFQSQTEFTCQSLCSWQLLWNWESLHNISSFFLLLSLIWNWWLLSLSQAAFPLNACNSVFYSWFHGPDAI